MDDLCGDLKLTLDDFVRSHSSQGCSAFNPVMMYSRQDFHDMRQSARAVRHLENSRNRRVVAFLFSPRTQIDEDEWPCRLHHEGIEPCLLQFWTDSEDRRSFGERRRYHYEHQLTFACKFYSRLADDSPCENATLRPDHDPERRDSTADYGGSRRVAVLAVMASDLSRRTTRLLARSYQSALVKTATSANFHLTDHSWDKMIEKEFALGRAGLLESEYVDRSQAPEYAFTIELWTKLSGRFKSVMVVRLYHRKTGKLVRTWTSRSRTSRTYMWHTRNMFDNRRAVMRRGEPVEKIVREFEASLRPGELGAPDKPGEYPNTKITALGSTGIVDDRIEKP
jgi:hypothetical protein